MSYQTKILSAILLMLVSFSSLSWAQPSEEATVPDMSDLPVFVDSILNTQMQSMDVAQATVSIVYKGELVYANGYGMANIEKKIPVTADKTLFRIGSISKLFTWTAVMQLAEKGKVDLDADVNIYLKTFQIPDTYDDPITLRHILTHTAGFEEGGLGYLIVTDPKNIIAMEDAMSRYLPRRINPPGVYSSYSNYATALAGLVVQNVSGMPFSDYIDQEIFKPLGMNNSSFQEPLPKGLAENVATAYARELGVYEAKPFELVANFAPAGAVSATATDMAKFMIANLNGGEYKGVRILEAETAKDMHAVHFAADKRLPAMALGFYEEHINGRRLIGHGGDTFFFHSNMLIDQDADLGIYVSYMGDDGGDARDDFYQVFYDRYFPKQTETITPPSDFASRAAQYAGTYKFWRHNQSTVEKATSMTGNMSVVPTEENTLLINALGKERQYVEIGEHLFRQVDGSTKIAFGLDEGGNVQDLYIDRVPFMAASRVSSAESGLMTGLLPFVSLFLMLTVWLGWIYRRREFKTMSSAERTAIKMSLTMSGLNLGFVISAIAVVSYYQWTLFTEIPLAFTMALILPNLAAIAAVVVIWFAIRAWREGFWNLGRRIHYSLVAAAGLFLIWFCYYWNLLGVQIP